MLFIAANILPNKICKEIWAKIGKDGEEQLYILDSKYLFCHSLDFISILCIFGFNSKQIFKSKPPAHVSQLGKSDFFNINYTYAYPASRAG